MRSGRKGKDEKWEKDKGEKYKKSKGWKVREWKESIQLLYYYTITEQLPV